MDASLVSSNSMNISTSKPSGSGRPEDVLSVLLSASAAQGTGRHGRGHVAKRKGQHMAQAATLAMVDPKVAEFVTGSRRMLIDGVWVEAASGKTFPVYDPATEEVIAQVVEGDSEDIARAVRAARRAFDAGPWRKVTHSERGRMLWRLADLLEAGLAEFDQLETLEYR